MKISTKIRLVLLLGATFPLAQGSQGQPAMESGSFFEGTANGEIFEPSDPEVQDALDTTARLLDRYAQISASNGEYDYADFRENQLEPAIRRMSDAAKKSKNKEVLYSAIALASCDLNAEKRGSFWSAKVTEAMRVFSPSDVLDVFSRLPPESLERVKVRVLKGLDSSDPLREVLVKTRTAGLGLLE